MRRRHAAMLVLLGLALGGFGEASALAGSADDEKTVAELDTRYQAAVEKNDADTMAKILADDFVLVTGRGKAFTKEKLVYGDRFRTAWLVDRNFEEITGTQKVRVWGDTAVVTALLWIKGTREGKATDYKLWFSDTYVRTKDGWRYVFGQASIALPQGS